MKLHVHECLSACLSVRVCVSGEIGAGQSQCVRIARADVQKSERQRQRQTDRQTDRDSETNRQTDKQTERQRERDREREREQAHRQCTASFQSQTAFDPGLPQRAILKEKHRRLAQTSS